MFGYDFSYFQIGLHLPLLGEQGPEGFGGVALGGGFPLRGGALDEYIGIVVDAAQHMVHGLALDDVLDRKGVILVDHDVGFVGRAEEVVAHAENVLVGPGEEEGHEIGLITPGFVQGNLVPHILQVNEFIHFPIAVAGDVAQGGG